MVFLFVDLEKLIYYIMILKHNQTKIDYISSDLTTGLQTNFYNLYFAVTCAQLCMYNVGIQSSRYTIRIMKGIIMVACCNFNSNTIYNTSCE